MGLGDLFRKDTNYTDEYNRFKKALKRTPSDMGLKAQFIKFCLLNRFTKHEAMETHVSEALGMFESVEHSEHFDLQCYYLMGKYFQEVQDQRQAYRTYLNGIKRFNRLVVKSPEMKADNVELAYSISLNLMALQSDPIEPELELCFKLIRKSFPLHLKRVELENEMAKPAPDPAKIKQLSEEVKRLKAEEEKGSSTPEEGKKEVVAQTFVIEGKKLDPAPSNGSQAKQAPAEEAGKAAPEVRSEPAPKTVKTPSPAAQAPAAGGPKGIFSKLFTDLSPSAMGLTSPVKMEGQAGKGEKESFMMSPLYDYTKGATFMAYNGDKWEGPYTAFQLRSMDFFKPATWICRVGSQQVIQAYEAPEILPLFQHQVQ